MNERSLDSHRHFRRLTFVRHGETEGESSVRYHGRTDVRLSPSGRAQMERVRAALAGEHFAAVYSSTLCRAIEAAHIVSGLHDGAPHRVGGFDEIDFGAWEGLTLEEIQRRDPAGYARWHLHGAGFQYPGGESNAAFRGRVARALHATLSAAPPGDLLFVVHKGIIRSCLGELLGFDETRRHGVEVALGSIHVVRQERGRWRAECLDRTDHLR